jgi:amidase
MTRSVSDAAILLGVIAGIDPRDAATHAAKSHVRRDYTQFLDIRGLAGARIGVARKYFGFHPAVDGLMEQALDAMRREGAEIIDPVSLPSRAELAGAELQVLLFEFRSDLDRYLADLGDSAPHRSLAEIITFNDNNREAEMRYFGQEVFQAALAFDPASGDAYAQALATARRLSRDEGIDQALRTHALDALAAPTGGPAWTSDLVNGDHIGGGCSTMPAAAGYPHITVPAGFVHGLPVGISFFAGAWSEPALLKLAYAFEQATKVRRQPTFSATLDL